MKRITEYVHFETQDSLNAAVTETFVAALHAFQEKANVKLTDEQGTNLLEAIEDACDTFCVAPDPDAHLSPEKRLLKAIFGQGEQKKAD